MIFRTGHARLAASRQGASTPITSSRTPITTLPRPWGSGKQARRAFVGEALVFVHLCLSLIKLIAQLLLLIGNLDDLIVEIFNDRTVRCGGADDKSNGESQECSGERHDVVSKIDQGATYPDGGAEPSSDAHTATTRPAPAVIPVQATVERRGNAGLERCRRRQPVLRQLRQQSQPRPYRHPRRGRLLLRQGRRHRRRLDISTWTYMPADRSHRHPNRDQRLRRLLLRQRWDQRGLDVGTRPQLHRHHDQRRPHGHPRLRRLLLHQGGHQRRLDLNTRPPLRRHRTPETVAAQPATAIKRHQSSSTRPASTTQRCSPRPATTQQARTPFATTLSHFQADVAARGGCGRPGD